jgi:hypothetical protein
MGPQYTIVRAIGMTTATWYKLGTLTLADATAVSMFTLELTTQNPIGGFRAAVVRFSSNGGNFVRNTYDATPVAFNAYVQAQSTSKDWFLEMSGDLAVTQLSNSSYAFYLKVYPDVGAGFFSVQHASGDSFAYEGLYTSTTKPAQGVHPFILAVATPDGIGALPVVNPNMVNPSVQGTLACQNVTASGTLGVTGATTLAGTTASSLTVNGASSLQGTLGVTGATTLAGTTASSLTVNGASSLQGTLNVSGFTTLGAAQASSFGVTNNITGALFQASIGFTSTSGTLSTAASSSQTLHTLTANQRLLIFVETDTTNGSSAVAYCSNLSGVVYMTIIARNGNAYSSQNFGSAFVGTWNMNLFVLSTGAIRCSTTSAGSVRWNILFLSS